MKHRCVNGKVRGARIGMISASLMVTMIMVMSQAALATDRYVYGTGSTYIDDNGCYGNVPNGPPASLDVDNGDNVIINYSYTYTDRRTGSPGVAAHDFVQVVTYGSWTWADGKRHNTSGMYSGSGSIQRTVYSVQTSTYLYVAWYANVTSDSCNNGDMKGGNIWLY